MYIIFNLLQTNEATNDHTQIVRRSTDRLLSPQLKNHISPAHHIHRCIHGFALHTAILIEVLWNWIYYGGKAKACQLIFGLFSDKLIPPFWHLWWNWNQFPWNTKIFCSQNRLCCIGLLTHSAQTQRIDNNNKKSTSISEEFLTWNIEEEKTSIWGTVKTWQHSLMEESRPARLTTANHLSEVETCYSTRFINIFLHRTDRS